VFHVKHRPQLLITDRLTFHVEQGPDRCHA